MNHKAWLDNEYSLWVEALKESTVHNFKEHPMVKRMLSEIHYFKFIRHVNTKAISDEVMGKIMAIENIGRERKESTPPGECLRMMYYAIKVTKINPKSIVEIGGGVGQFYAILRALGYTGTYYIYDLPEVQKFQRKYLDEVSKQTGLNTELKKGKSNYCVSFYALGEFDDETKAWYVENVVKKCPHGLIIWNGHSGASNDINFPCKIEDEYPLTSEGNKQLTW